MKYTKQLTVKEWKKFDHIVDQEDGNGVTAQEILLRKYKIILTNHKSKGRVKFVRGEYLDENGILQKESYNFNLRNKVKEKLIKLSHTDIDKTLTQVTKNIDDFSSMMDSMKGIGGKQKDLSGLYQKPRLVKSKRKTRKNSKKEPEVDRIWNSNSMSFSGKGLKLR